MLDFVILTFSLLQQFIKWLIRVQKCPTCISHTWWLAAVTTARVNWWRNAWRKTGRRGCRSQCACATARRRSSRARTGSGEAATWPARRAEGRASTPASSPARGRNWSEGTADVRGGWTRKAPLSSNNCRPCTSGSSALRTGAAGRRWCWGNGCGETRMRNGVGVERRRLSCWFLRAGRSRTAPGLAGRTGPRPGRSLEWDSGTVA